MYGLLKGKKGIIFGALNDQSIAWKVAERCHEEGAEFIPVEKREVIAVIAYLQRLGTDIKTSEVKTASNN